jgi:hypothetical protein
MCYKKYSRSVISNDLVIASGRRISFQGGHRGDWREDNDFHLRIGDANKTTLVITSLLFHRSSDGFSPLRRHVEFTRPCIHLPILRGTAAKLPPGCKENLQARLVVFAQYFDKAS